MMVGVHNLSQALETRCDELQRENDELRRSLYALHVADQHKYHERRWQGLSAREKCLCYTFHSPNTGVKVQPI